MNYNIICDNEKVYDKLPERSGVILTTMNDCQLIKDDIVVLDCQNDTCVFYDLFLKQRYEYEVKDLHDD